MCSKYYAGIKQTVSNLDVGSLYILTYWLTTSNALPNGVQILIDGTLISNATSFWTCACVCVYDMCEMCDDWTWRSEVYSAHLSLS